MTSREPQPWRDSLEVGEPAKDDVQKPSGSLGGLAERFEEGLLTSRALWHDIAERAARP